MEALTDTARDQILVTMEMVNQELGRLELDIKQRMNRAEALRKLLRAGDAVLETPVPILDAPPVMVPSVFNEVPQTARQKATWALEKHGQPMSVDEIYQCLVAYGYVEGKNPREALKTALRSYPSEFRKVKDGVYELTAWA